MSKISTKPPSGMRDFLPLDIARRRHVVGIVEQTYQRYGFVPLETPAIENLSTLLGKYGAEGDQLLYRLLHRRDALARALDREQPTETDLADQGLRYDLTVPLARVVAQYRELPRFLKRYQIQPVWRADRPGRGRFREFYQCDVDVIGTQSVLAEAEVCGAAAEALQRLGFDAFTIRLNHRQLLRALIQTCGIDEANESTALIALDKLDKIGRDGVRSELAQRGISARSADKLLELLANDDSADEQRVAVTLRNQLTTDEGRRALDELVELRELLAATPAANHVRICPDLARGLSYYTGPIFEVTISGLSGSVGGGGRYDDLIGMFGRQQIPAVGFSLGLERLLLLMQEQSLYPELPTGPDVLLCWRGVERANALGAAHALRAQGLRVELFPEATKLGKQLQYADAIGAPVAAIVGEQELADETITLKGLARGEQETVARDRAAETIQRLR
jgi:histidyl-tRNA synthetase